VQGVISVRFYWRGCGRAEREIFVRVCEEE
jgi:hypothetical protein